ncbi:MULTISPECIES: STAS domain-containing protein [unclassified Duganella]|uniref:STAS domain-containing protein n=1 Tax=unclassified Duganella TaxID=2636909 RepID=UPI00088C7F72|nr:MULTISPECIES: STAS domain-containing protein [unclassified Duganella]SDG96532.1 ABC-type transporter Mla maintaining outer membrane lipid asymmetry, MlaB component, contains STAS domain [Duganella sp. OV458]SDJ45772.1 ABC-type transporter Mla maintaining outer membrane lipid asymmetry, MlaB component, contains STAS domain [Duganella sp. OV510]
MDMGLFSLFRKAEPLPPLTDDEQARLAANSEAQRHSQAVRQREIARATAMKIDAIESAMEADIFSQDEPAWGSQRPARTPRAADTEAGPDDIATTLLLIEELPLAAADASAPAVEEIAILYANGQAAAAQQLLLGAVAEAQGLNSERSAWWMLFDLYQASGQQDAFDNLSIDYASTFETSPPQWIAPAALAAASPAWAGLTPTAALAGVLDQHIAPQLERLGQQAEASPVLRLEFTRVTAVTADGCALLLETLRRLQTRQCELILVGAPALAARLRDGIMVGRRDDGEAPWLLLLELLQLQQREKEYEQAAMDYCVTFEVSPPSFTPPHKVAMAPAQHLSASPDRFMLPPVIEHQLGPLLPAIQQYAEAYPALVFDCARLTRIDYASAIQLHSVLQQLADATPGRKIAFRDVNHLVTALLRLLGFANLARMYPHKY